MFCEGGLPFCGLCDQRSFLLTVFLSSVSLSQIVLWALTLNSHRPIPGSCLLQACLHCLSSAQLPGTSSLSVPRGSRLIVSPKAMSKSRPSVPVSVALLGKRVFADVMKGLEMRWSWVGMGPTSKKDACKRKDTETQAQRTQSRGDRWEHCSYSQGTPKVAWSHFWSPA